MSEEIKPRFFKRTCAQCGHEWIGHDSTCPSCRGTSKSAGEEMTKKIIEPPDLLK